MSSRAKKPVAPPGNHGTVTAQSWSGPLPPPAALEQFDRIIPNGADRILRMSEQEQANRHAMDLAALEANIRIGHENQAIAKRGLYSGVAVSFLAILGSVFSVYLGAHPSVSISLVSVTILGMVKTLTGAKDKK